jgi:hypothetical protein
MKKPISHVIDELAVEIFRAALPKDAWTIYDIRPDYGKDHKVELVEGEDHTGLTFWVQVKGQKKLSRLRDGAVSFKLETKDLDYHLKLATPVFLVVVDVANRVGYWVFTQRYERTALRNVDWRSQGHIQIRLLSVNVLSDLAKLRREVKDAIQYMTRLFFRHDVRSERKMLEERDPRFRVDIIETSDGRHYHFESDEVVPLEVTYKGADSGAGRIGELLDRGLPVVFRPDEIELRGSKLYETFLEMSEGRDIRLEANQVHKGHINLLRSDTSGAVLGRIDAIPCTIVCGRKEARVEGKLGCNILSLGFVAAFEQGETRPLSMPIDLTAWSGHRLSSLPFFEPVGSVFGESQPGERFSIECFVPGQKWLSGPLDMEEDQPFQGITALIDILRKARAVASLKQLDPRLPEDFGSPALLKEILELHAILIGDGHTMRTPGSRIRVTVTRAGLRRFLDDLEAPSSLGTLHLHGDGVFPFLGESVAIDRLESIITSARLVDDLRALRNELKRSPRKKEFRLSWEATEATRTTLISKRDDGLGNGRVAR